MGGRIMFKKIFQEIFKWFVKMVWPQIQKLLIAYIIDFFEWGFAEIKNSIQNRNKRQEDFAKNKVEDELLQAQAARTSDEAEMHMKMAEMWRLVADNLREENEILKNDLERIKDKVINRATDNVQQLKVDEVFELKDDKTVKLKEMRPIALLEAGSESNIEKNT